MDSLHAAHWTFIPKRRSLEYYVCRYTHICSALVTTYKVQFVYAHAATVMSITSADQLARKG